MRSALSLLVLLVMVMMAMGESPPLRVREANGPDYLALKAVDKLSLLWENCIEELQSSQWFNFLQMAELFVEPMCPVFRTSGDQLEKGRGKFIHTVGAVGKVEWQSSGDHPYTGVFRGGQHGLARFSVAKEPKPSVQAMIPGMGLKFLRDSTDSANLLAMESVQGQQSWNFFKYNFSNHVPYTGFAFLPVAIKFSKGSKNIRQVGLSDWARFYENGTESVNPIFPYRLRFQPADHLQLPDAYVRPFTDDLQAIARGSQLFTIYALDQPPELGGKELEIGKLVLVSDVVTSNWADRSLYFRHQDMADDLRLRPDWNQFTPKFEPGDQPSPVGTSPCDA